MTTKTFLTIAWNLGEVEIVGPYPDKDTAQSILGENILGNPDMSGAVIGPLPFEQVITDGEWGGGSTELDKSIARQWAVFETTDATVQWMAFGNDPEEFDRGARNGRFEWIGNYEGSCPRDAYALANADREQTPGTTIVAIPVGVFGPADWMRVAGDMLTKIKDV